MAPKSKEKGQQHKSAGGQLKKKKAATATPTPNGGGGSDRRFEFSTAAGLLRSLPELYNLIASDVTCKQLTQNLRYMRAAHKGYSKVHADFEQCEIVPAASQKLFADIVQAYEDCTAAYVSLYPDNAEDFKSDAPDKVTTGKRLDEIEAKLAAIQETGSSDHVILKKIHKMLIKIRLTTRPPLKDANGRAVADGDESGFEELESSDEESPPDDTDDSAAASAADGRSKRLGSGKTPAGRAPKLARKA